ncbi:MAG TPA: hypothetical protein VHO25_09885 [Polyangiaceae bacterium]|nr:hypothetical protein [Polyangiaceae bacterium]
MRTTTQWIALVGLSLGTFACEEKASTETQAEKPAEVAQKPAPKAEVKPASVKQEAAPAVDTSWQLTDARRSAIESAIVDAKGFLDAQQQLLAAKPADSAAALKALDTSAKGKWLLLVGSVSKVSDNGLEISVSTSDGAAAAAAAPAANQPTADKAATDKPSAAAQGSSVAIAVTKIDGFKKDAYQVDQKIAVLAQYTGAGQAQPAYDVVAMGKWQPSDSPVPAAAGNPAAPAQGAAEQAAPGTKPAVPAAATKPEGKY